MTLSSRSAVFCSFLLISAHMGVAQRITGSIAGTVKDPTGAVVPGATVQVINAGTQATAKQVTDQGGHFVAPTLPPGQYNLSIQANGFKKLDRSGINLDVDQTVSLDLSLQIGSTNETVQVSGEAPLLDTTSAELGQVISDKDIVNLPLNQRNPFSLILLAPGVSGSIGSSFTGLAINVNGGRQGSTDVLLDGIPSTPPTDDFNVLTIFPSVDAVQEFKVQTSSYSAQFGISGGGIINLIYKSGTNNFHGSLYEFLRNSVLDSNNFFSNQNGIPLASFKRNQFGVTVGGPVIIPKLYNGRNKTFFFADYEGLRQRSASTATNTVPTAAERSGNFSQDTTSTGARINIYDPVSTTQVGSTYTRVPFPNNTIPASRLDPVSANILKYWPSPNTAGTNGTQVNNWFGSSVAPYDIDQGDIKVDQIISDKQRMSIRFSKRNPTSAPAIYFPSSIAIAQNGSTNTQNAIAGAFDYVYTVSPTYLMEFRAGVSHLYYTTATTSDGFDPTQLGFPTYLRNTANALAFPSIEPSGYLSIGAGNQLSQGSLGMLVDTYALNNTKTFSKHTLNFGAEVRAYANNTNQTGRSTGDFTFYPLLTQGPNAQSSSSTSGDGFASFLLGLGSGSSGAGGGTVTHNFKIIDTVSQYLGAYFQDDWKVTSKLTLNLGLRYDLFFPRTERHDRMTYLDFADPSPLAAVTGLPLKAGLAYVGVNGNSRTATFTELLNFSPRFGLAYQATKSMVFRGGYGIIYSDSPTEAAATINPTGYRTDSTYYGTLDGLTPNNYLSNPFPGSSFVPVTGNTLGLLTAVGQGISSTTQYSPNPYSENWNFGMDYQLPGNWLLSGAYAGSHGVSLTYTQSLNQLPDSDLALGSKLLTTVNNPFYGLITGSTPLASRTIQERYLLAPYPQFTGVSLYTVPGASSMYHSVQLKLNKRFSNGLTLLLSFTGSKLMDDSSSNNSNFNGSGTAQDAYNRRADWSLSTIDVSKRFVGSFVYNLPFGHGQHFGSKWNRVTDSVLGGWQVNGIVTAQTGIPLALSATNNANIFNPGERPNSNGQNAGLSGSVESRLTKYFNTSVFSQPATYTFGNVSRTLPNLRAPGLRNIDFSLFKNFALTERWKLEVRAESFNLSNTPQFGAPNTSVTSTSFGVITTQVNSPRQNQIAMKLLF